MNKWTDGDNLSTIYSNLLEIFCDFSAKTISLFKKKPSVHFQIVKLFAIFCVSIMYKGTSCISAVWYLECYFTNSVATNQVIIQQHHKESLKICGSILRCFIKNLWNQYFLKPTKGDISLTNVHISISPFQIASQNWNVFVPSNCGFFFCNFLRHFGP